MPAPVGLPTIARTSQSCCFSKCLPCVNLNFLRTAEGILKLVEIILGSICQNLLISSGFTLSLALGSSYYSFLTASSSCMTTSFVLLLCYVISSSTVGTLRGSMFETVFNAFGAFLYLTSSCYLAFAVHTYLYPVHKIATIFETFPATSSTYITGFILAAVHGYDAYLAYNT